jgi:hypothetical protein
MRTSFINAIHLNNFKKYVLKSEHKKQNHLRYHLKKNNSANIFYKNSNTPLPINYIKIFPDTSLNLEEKKCLDSPLKQNSISNRKYLTPLQKLKKKFLEHNKNVESNSLNDFLTPLKKKFSLSNLVNALLHRMYMDNSYKKLLISRLEPFMKKKEKKLDIKIDIKKTLNKTFYIPIKKDTHQLKIAKKEIGIQNSISSVNIFEDNNNENIITIYNNNIKSQRKENSIKPINYNVNKAIINDTLAKTKKNFNSKNYKLKFNKHDLINKEIAKNYLEYYKNNGYLKVRRIVNVGNRKIGEVLDKLKYEQNNDNDKLKLQMARFEGYFTKKTKKMQNNNYNLFL